MWGKDNKIQEYYIYQKLVEIESYYSKTHSTLDKISSRQHIEIFFIIVSSAELDQRVVKVNIVYFRSCIPDITTNYARNTARQWQSHSGS